MGYLELFTVAKVFVRQDQRTSSALLFVTNATGEFTATKSQVYTTIQNQQFCRKWMNDPIKNTVDAR